MPPRREAPGAIPLVLHAAIAGLRERHELTLVTAFGDEPGEAEAVAELRADGLAVHAVDRRQPAATGARWRRRARLTAAWARGADPWRTIWFADPGVQRILDGLDARAYDVVSVEDNAMAGFRLPGGLPSVLTEYEVRRPRRVDRRLGPPAHWLAEADWHRWPGYERRVWRRFDRLQVFTARDAAHAAEIAPDLRESIVVNPFGVDAPEAGSVGGGKDRSLLFMGNFTHPPNRDAAEWLVREIMPQLRSRVTGVSLTVVGSGAPEGFLADAPADVRYAGEVPDAAPEVARAAVVVAPIRTGGGMRMKVLYALAGGKAVVTTTRGAEGLLLDGERPLVIADDADEFAAQTAALLEDPAARRALGERALAFARERHSPAAYARRLEATYEGVIA
jgi:glycosyltransferase involved in cell wall biosynthesis